jgi:RNA-directed DNA polymerase
MQEDGFEQFMQDESLKEPSSVCDPQENSKQGGEALGRWSWVESSVWTKRMLTALDKGVKGDVWFSLNDKVYSPDNLKAAYSRVRVKKGAAGVDHVTLKRFEKNLECELQGLHEELKHGRYTPKPVRRAWIPKGNGEERPLGIPTVRDRIVQTALRNVIEPIFEKEFAEHSYGFRPDKGTKDALRRVDGLLKNGYVHVVDADIKGYFDAIPKAALMTLVKERITDQRVLDLVQAFLDQSVKDKDSLITPETGTPQGAVISPLLANLYLNALDHHMAAMGYEMTRYADDFVVQCRSREEAEEALALISQWMDTAELTLHPSKTRIANMLLWHHFDFLGYRFQMKGDWFTRVPTPKSIKKFRDNIRRRTKRANGHSMERIIDGINPVIRGWHEYFKHSNKAAFKPLDVWIRVRLRSILRKRHRGKGRGRGLDHIKWPNKYFANLGLLNLSQARDMAAQSSLR